MKFVGIDIFIFGVYSIRVVFILVVKVYNVFIIIIMKFVGWFFESIFSKFYNKVIVGVKENFG